MSEIVTEHAIESRRILKQLVRAGKSCLPAKIEPALLRFRKVARGHVMVDLGPFLWVQHGPARPVDAAEALQILVARFAIVPRRLVEHEKGAC